MGPLRSVHRDAFITYSGECIPKTRDSTTTTEHAATFLRFPTPLPVSLSFETRSKRATLQVDREAQEGKLDLERERDIEELDERGNTKHPN